MVPEVTLQALQWEKQLMVLPNYDTYDLQPPTGQDNTSNAVVVGIPW